MPAAPRAITAAVASFALAWPYGDGTMMVMRQLAHINGHAPRLRGGRLWAAWPYAPIDDPAARKRDSRAFLRGLKIMKAACHPDAP